MSTDPNRMRIGVRPGVRIRSHERTNERTNGERIPDVSLETAVDAHACTGVSRAFVSVVGIGGRLAVGELRDIKSKATAGGGQEEDA